MLFVVVVVVSASSGLLHTSEGFHRSWLCTGDRALEFSESFTPPVTVTEHLLYTGPEAGECTQPRPLEAPSGGSHVEGWLKRL